MRRSAEVVVLLALLVQGCAAAPAERETALARGQLVVVPGRSGLVIGAPHGSSDESTDRMSRDLAQRTGFGLVLATGFTRIDSQGRRFHVNRPTEGLPGRPAKEEVYSADARLVYEAYAQGVSEVARGPLQLLVELHGNARQESAGRIEIATVGVDRQQAWQLRTLFELIRDAHLRSWPEAPRLAVLIEPLDRLQLSATRAKEIGVLRLPRRAFHIELPRAARLQAREAYLEILSEFLSEAARLLQIWRP
ncbi:MAG: hypothetical protein HY726_23310 [Candidatus Rokubacteria bacterium]|nr:hypothetical protein [Candidatus Rokubacteria bacterium]